MPTSSTTFFTAPTPYGTAGNDRYTGTSGVNMFQGQGGNDVIYGLGGNDYLAGGDGNDFVIGGDGNDSLHANAGNDTLNGGAGNDILYASGGQDLMIGGTGNDKVVLPQLRRLYEVVVVSDSILRVTYNGPATTATQIANLAGSTRVEGVETLQFAGNEQVSVASYVSGATTAGTSTGGFGSSTWANTVTSIFGTSLGGTIVNGLSSVSGGIGSGLSGLGLRNAPFSGAHKNTGLLSGGGA